MFFTMFWHGWTIGTQLQTLVVLGETLSTFIKYIKFAVKHIKYSNTYVNVIIYRYPNISPILQYIYIYIFIRRCITFFFQRYMAFQESLRPNIPICRPNTVVHHELMSGIWMENGEVYHCVFFLEIYFLRI